jgi:hypothetical protein
VDTTGETEIIEPDSPLCHWKEDPPSAVKIADSPKQMVPSLFVNPDLSATEIEAKLGSAYDNLSNIGLDANIA